MSVSFNKIFKYPLYFYYDIMSKINFERIPKDGKGDFVSHEHPVFAKTLNAAVKIGKKFWGVE